MKKITNIIAEAKQKLDIQDETLGFVSVSDLKKYVEIADKFLSQESKDVINWMIDAGDDYISKFGKAEDGGNAIAAFYDRGVPKDAEMKPVYKNIGKVVKSGRLLEIPAFQTKEQLDGILSKEIAPDEIILDFSTERGRNKVAAKYDKLVWKIAHSFNGKSNLTLDELYSAGLEGLTRAMNRYGKKSDYTKSEEAMKAYTFLSFASFMIRNQILHDIKHVSHIVRIPTSAQDKEKRETGRHTKSNTISGDKIVKNGDKGEKTVFDFMSTTDAGGNSAASIINREDAERIWNDIFKELEKKFDERTMDIWYSYNELNGHKKMKNKDLGTKYGLTPSQITYYLYIVNSFILKNKKMQDLFLDLKDIVSEGRAIKDSEKHVLDN